MSGRPLGSGNEKDKAMAFLHTYWISDILRVIVDSIKKAKERIQDELRVGNTPLAQGKKLLLLSTHTTCEILKSSCILNSLRSQRKRQDKNNHGQRQSHL